MEFLYRLYKWSERKILIFIVMASLSGALGLYTYGHIYKIGWGKSVLYTLELFAMDVKHPADVKELIWLENNNSKEFVLDNGEINGSYYADECMKLSHITHSWKVIYLAGFLATSTVVVGVFLFFFRSVLSNLYRRKIIRKGEHTIVVGLGKNSRFFINSMLGHEKHKMVVFEKRKENHYIEHYRNKRVALVEEDVENMLDKLNINKAKNIFISTGNDESNIYLAMKFMAKINDEDNSIEKLVVHIEDRTLRNLYDDEKALHKSNIDLRPFSFYKEAARRLFRLHPLEGDKYKIMDSEDDFHIVIVGNSEFSISLISEACRLSSLPNNNRLHIHCIGQKREVFEQQVLYAFPNIRDIENVKIHYLEADSTTLDFYHKKIWQTENLTHVIYADESVLENIRISTKVSDVTYLRDKSKIVDTKFHIATMNHIRVAEEIRGEFSENNIFTCAEANKICSRENLLLNSVDTIAKMIHYTYISHHFRKYDVKIRDSIINREWRKASVNDKRTSVAQAIHIDTKLKALGLKRKLLEEKLSLYRLYKRNLKLLKSRLADDMKQFGLNRDKLYEMEQAYKKRYEQEVEDGHFFPKEYKTKLEKMLRMEHNRWMTVLMLMDNIRDDSAENMTSNERKKLKIHHLLKPFSEFKSNKERIYVINDYNTIKNIARYMTLNNYEIVDFD